jgi:lipopolysaccharide heptosyltransferase I
MEQERPAILVVKLSSLGDLFHALPAVHRLKQGLNASIDWVCQREYADVVRCFTDVDNVIPFDRRPYPAGLRRVLPEIRARRYRYVVDAQGLMKSAIVAFLANARSRIGPSFHREGTWWLYDRVAGRRNKDRHAVEENLDVLDLLGIERGAVEFPVRFPERPLDGPEPRVALLPSSRWETKNWPSSCFAAVGRRLREVSGASIFLVGGPADAEACAAVEKEMGGEVTNLAGRTTLPELGGILKQMNLLVANDSGPVHMAAAVGTPALVVFGPTDPQRTGPYGEGHKVASARLPCQPCFSRHCRRDDIACLAGVTPEHVSELAVEMLARKGAASS